MINRTLKHARQQLALRALAVADAKADNRPRAQRLERASRKRLIEALRLADA